MFLDLLLLSQHYCYFIGKLLLLLFIISPFQNWYSFLTFFEFSSVTQHTNT